MDDKLYDILLHKLDMVIDTLYYAGTSRRTRCCKDKDPIRFSDLEYAKADIKYLLKAFRDAQPKKFDKEIKSLYATKRILQELNEL